MHQIYLIRETKPKKDMMCHFHRLPCYGFQVPLLDGFVLIDPIFNERLETNVRKNAVQLFPLGICSKKLHSPVQLLTSVNCALRGIWKGLDDYWVIFQQDITTPEYLLYTLDPQGTSLILGENSLYCYGDILKLSRTDSKCTHLDSLSLQTESHGGIFVVPPTTQSIWVMPAHIGKGPIRLS